MAASLKTSRPFSSARSVLTQRGDQALAANLGHRDFDFLPFGRSSKFLLESAQAPVFVLTNEFPNIFTGRSPVASCDLPFHIFFQSFREGDVE